MISVINVMMVITLLTNSAVLITGALGLHCLIPLSERLLPLRASIIICILIALFSIIPNLDLWAMMIILVLVITLCISLLYATSISNNRNGRVQLILNMCILAVTGLLLAQQLMLTAISFVIVIVSIVYFEQKLIPHHQRKQSYRFLCHIRSISTLTHIEKQLAHCLCQNTTTKLIKKEKLYLDIYYELSPLAQPILMRRLLQLKGVKTLVQY